MLDDQRSEDLLAAIASLQQEVATSRLDLPTIMHLIAARAQQVTRAQGAVVELLEDDEMVYAAATGTAASSLGLRLPAVSSLSGLCVMQRQVMWCDDASLDARVNWEACKKVGLRSMIVVPLHHYEEVKGVLKVLSPEPRAFTSVDRYVLQLMAGVLATCMSRATA